MFSKNFFRRLVATTIIASLIVGPQAFAQPLSPEPLAAAPTTADAEQAESDRLWILGVVTVGLASAASLAASIALIVEANKLSDEAAEERIGEHAAIAVVPIERDETRFARLREHVLAMKALWTEDEAEFHGEFVDFDPLWCDPKPVRKPHPPLLMGGETDHTLRRVVDYCDGWFPRPTHGFDPEKGMARLREIAEAAGRDPASLSVTVFRLPSEKAEVERYANVGIERGLLQFSGIGREEVLRNLDEFAPLLD